MNLSKFIIAFSLLSALAVAFPVGIRADENFRKHRFDSFKACPTTSRNCRQGEGIVFFGNSITNMHDWREAFGSDPRILNRGNSGALSKELLDNADCVIALHPAKLFIGIGTNDLGTEGLNSPELIADNIRRIILRFREESPQTRIYVQSILPSEVGIRNLDAERAANSRIKGVCAETGATFIDLFDDMMPILDGTFSYDGLHLTADAYRIWCRKIAPFVGLETIYSDDFIPDDSGMKGSFGMRSTYWSAYPVERDDILFIGDEMVHGGEWHELTGNPNFKNRGIGWGYGGISLGQWSKNMKAILAANPGHKTAPAEILLYIGVNAANGKTPLARIDSLYRNVIDSIRAYAPTERTKLTLLSLIPREDANINSDRIVPINELIARIADETANCDFLDIYTPLLLDSVADPAYIKDDYLYSDGYRKVAELLK